MAKKYITTFDLETTGKNVEKDKICWICLKKINKETKQIEEVFNRYVNPVIPIEPDAEKIHGLSNNFLSNYLVFKEIAQIIVNFLSDSDIISGYNIMLFDIPILQRELDEAGSDFVICQNMKILDSFNIFKRDTPRTLVAAYKYYTGNDLEGAHDASVDVDATISVLLKQIEEHSDMSIDELCSFSTYDSEIFDINNKFYKSNGDVFFNFGKHKDKRPKDVDRKYIEWVMSLEDFPKSSLKILKDAMK